jgi:flagellin
VSLVVNTNLSSITTQNYLSTTQSQLAKATQRLASGLRVNSASDDAAGYAIAQRLTAQVNGSNTAVQNANNAVSLAQTAQGSLAEITNNLQRVRELAVESANATNSASDRQSLNNEATQLLQEVDRVASSSSFNGTKLLDGTFTSQQFQVGANAGDTISITSITSARIGSLGNGFSALTNGTVAVGTTVTGAGQLVINGKDVYQGSAISADAQSLANAINAAGIGGVTAAAAPTVSAATVLASGTAADAGAITINGVATASLTATGVGATDLNNAVAAINAISAATGVSASISGGLKLTAVDGRDISFSTGGTLVAGDISATGIAATTYSTVSLSSTNSTALTTSGATATALGFAASTNAALSGTSLLNIDISTVAGSNTALASIDNALNTINSTNAALGAYQNRFQSAVANLHSTSQNLTAARSTIVDADFAAETANETRASVLQQAGVAVLGQANSQPQQVLSLLQHL